MILYLVLFFILGTVVGSFLNVVVDRTTRGESILGRSHCENCGITLSTFDLVPILSFVGLGARCRHCGAKLSWQYPIVETLAGFLFALSFWTLAFQNNFSLISLAFLLIIVSVVIVVGVVDFKFSLIPTTFVYAAALIALFYNFFYLPTPLFIDSIVAAFGAAIFFLFIVLVTWGRGMGQGDIVLAFLIGIVLGVKATLLALFLAFLSGAVISVLLIILGRKKFGNTIPFGPFLVLGFLVALFFGGPILNFWFSMLY